jgi:4-hydroxy-3-methylbut-2-enyl diphosphate reductase
VQQVVERLAPTDGVEVVSLTDEDEYFPPPAELRQLLRGLVAALSLTGEAPDDVLGGDRSSSASAVLASLGR